MSKKSSWRVDKLDNPRRPKQNTRKKTFVSNDVFFNDRSHKKSGIAESRNQPLINMKRSGFDRHKSFKPKESTLYDLTPYRNNRRMTTNEFHGHQKEQKNLPRRDSKERFYEGRSQTKSQSRLFKENRVDRCWDNYTHQGELGSPSMDSSDIQKSSKKNFRRSPNRISRSPENSYHQPRSPVENRKSSNTPPHNPWLSEVKKSGLLKSNLNNTSFHIYPKNRKQATSRSRSPKPYTPRKTNWRPVTKILRDESKERKMYFNTMSEDTFTMGKLNPPRRYDDDYDDKENCEGGGFKAPRKYRNKTGSWNMTETSFARVSDIGWEEEEYDRRRRTPAASNEKIEFRMF